jgi:hypothetical protein
MLKAMRKATVRDEHAASVRPGNIKADGDGTAAFPDRYAFLHRTGTMSAPIHRYAARVRGMNPGDAAQGLRLPDILERDTEREVEKR